MLDTVRVWREAQGDGVDENGNPEVVTTEVYAGPARLLLSSTVVRDVDAQSQLLAVQSPRLDLPSDTAGVLVGDLFEITASQTDATVVGVAGRVAGFFPHSQATARRLPVEVWS